MSLTKMIANMFLGASIVLGLGCNKLHSEEDGKENIRPLILYAMQFKPCTPEGDCRNLYRTPEEVTSILESHELTQDYKASVMLVLLKQYNYEYSNFHQGYELRKGLFEKESAFVTAYLRIVGRYSDDYMTARVSYDWVKGHPEFLKNKLIAEEMKKIDDTAKEIEEMNKNLEKEFEQKNSQRRNNKNP